MTFLNLRLLQLSDSALPIGGYTHSWGLEAALARGMVYDGETLETWTRCWLRFSLGPGEGVVMASAFRAARQANPTRIRQANAILMASINPPSARTASLEMGEQLLSLARTWSWSAAGVVGLLGEATPELFPPTPSPEAFIKRGAKHWHHAVVFGVLAALAGASPDDALAAYLHQAALGMIGAALRAAPIGHTHGQQVLAYLHDDIGTLTTDLADRDLEQAGSCNPFHEVLCDEQTRLYTRLFRS
jgi:urease accessory protein